LAQDSFGSKCLSRFCVEVRQWKMNFSGLSNRSAAATDASSFDLLRESLNKSKLAAAVPQAQSAVPPAAAIQRPGLLRSAASGTAPMPQASVATSFKASFPPRAGAPDKPVTPKQPSFGLSGNSTSPIPQMQPTPQRSSPESPRFLDADLNQQVAEWDTQMDSLDRSQESVMHEKWKLMRTQIASLMQGLSEMRSELHNLKDHLVSEEMERTIESMIIAHDEHGQNHSSTCGRIASLEQFIGKEQLDRQLDEMSTLAKNFQAEAQTSVATRLDFLEGELTNRPTMDHHITMEERTAYLEQFLGESALKHEKEMTEHGNNLGEHKVTMETRLEYLESLLGDSADKHSKAIEDANGKLGDIHAAVQLCAKAEHHSNLDARVGYLEKSTGESADKHEQDLADHKLTHITHKTTMETRLVYLEALLGDSADKHATEIGAANGRLEDLHAAILKCAKTEHHETLASRLEFLEALLGDSADKHAKEIDAAHAKLGDLHAAVALCAQSEHHATLETRLDYMESLLGDSADKHAKEIDAAHAKLGDLHAAVAQCAQSEHHASLETRLEYLEALQGDSADKHTKQIEEAQSKLGDLHAAVAACAQSGNHLSLEKRVDYLETHHLHPGGGTKVNHLQEKLKQVGLVLQMTQEELEQDKMRQ